MPKSVDIFDQQAHTPVNMCSNPPDCNMEDAMMSCPRAIFTNGINLKMSQNSAQISYKQL